MAKIAVAPLVGAWIEIFRASTVAAVTLSLPSWERGLKSVSGNQHCARSYVAPLVGAWIEIIRCPMEQVGSLPVAPLVGAWIEMEMASAISALGATVAPLVGAWIEIPKA